MEDSCSLYTRFPKHKYFLTVIVMCYYSNISYSNKLASLSYDINKNKKHWKDWIDLRDLSLFVFFEFTANN